MSMRQKLEPPEKSTLAARRGRKARNLDSFEIVRFPKVKVGATWPSRSEPDGNRQRGVHPPQGGGRNTMLIAGSEHQVLAVPPRVVAETRLEFRRTALEFLEHVMRRHASRVILDMRQTTEVDASGLGVLVLLQKRARERMIATTLFRAPPSVKQMLQLTKLDYLFELED